MSIDSVQSPLRVGEKWGFGMAPIKPYVQAQRLESARTVLDVVDHGLAARREHHVVLEAISETKGLFNGVARSDQWDWFTVWMQIGRLSPRNACPQSAEALGGLRRAFAELDRTRLADALDRLDRAGGVQALEWFVEGRPAPHELGLGYVYVLSTRESRGVLKIGYTKRDVVDRVNEINRATGVVIPYGVRGLWAVKDADIVEAGVHKALASYRVRPDREFFNLEFRQAERVISQYVRQHQIGQ